MKQVELAMLLLRRKELNDKVDILAHIKGTDLFEVKARRQQVTDNIDDVVVQVPKLTLSQFTEEYDSYASKLRKVDALIQRTNWATMVEIDPELLENYKTPDNSNVPEKA